MSALVCLLLLGSVVDGVVLVENGKAKAAIVLPSESLPIEQEAASEIVSHVELMSGVNLPIIQSGEANELTPIRVGRACSDALHAELEAFSSDPSAFLLSVGDGGVDLVGRFEPKQIEAIRAYKALPSKQRRGKSPAETTTGTRTAAYELLEQLGVRWFLPGELGRVVPHSKSITLKNQKTMQTPSFKSRHLQAIYADTWSKRMRHGGMYFPASHGLPGMGSHGAKGGLFEEHPEYFSLIDGERRPRQHCISNPAVVQRVTDAALEFFRANPDAAMIGMGANDGRGFCECEHCLALDADDFDSYGDYPSMTDRYVWLFNRVLENISDEFPDKKIGFYAYSVYNRPPLKTEPNPRIVPAIALITLCREHGMNNPICPEKQYEQWIIAQWGKLVPDVFYRGYWFNLADPGLPFFQISRVAHEIPMGHRLNITGWRVESPYNWAGEAPTRYIASKLMWNHQADVEALMQDFGDKFFGPAGKPMLQYIQTMDQARAGGDYHTGSSWDAPRIYHADVRRAARAALNTAKNTVDTGSLYAQRIEVYETAFDYLESFVDMLQSRGRHDYVASKHALDRIDALREQLRGYGKERQNDPNPPMISRKAGEYMQRFFRLCTEDGYAKTTGDNKFLVGLGDTWQTQLDFAGVGNDVGWYKPANVGGNWQQMMTTGGTWSDQGLRYYKGDVWYRQKVNIPAFAKGKRVFFWIGAFDEAVEVWVNGVKIGMASGTFRPKDFDATDAIEPGAVNSVTVRATNEKLNELGTGGIMGPSMFYVPGDPEAKPTAEAPATDAATSLETIAE